MPTPPRPAAHLPTWQDTPDALPTGTPRVHTVSSGQFLALAQYPNGHEYARMRRRPDLYDERDLEIAVEHFLIANSLTEWPCEGCGFLNLTPDADFHVHTPCEGCGR